MSKIHFLSEHENPTDQMDFDELLKVGVSFRMLDTVSDPPKTSFSLDGRKIALVR